MTTGESAKRATFQVTIDADTPGRILSFLERTLKPPDGWLAFAFLGLNLTAVVLSVERADWVPTPNLIGVLLLAMVVALALYRLPVWPGLTLVLGLVAGLAIIIWQMVSYQVDGQALGSVDELWARLELWFEAARSGSISIDKVPFAFGLMVAAWLTGFLGAWLFLRHRNFWGVFLLGGFGLFSNLTFLPPNTVFLLGAYLFTALLVVARVQAMRRQDRWQERDVRFDKHLVTLTMGDSFFLALAVLVIAFSLPAAGQWRSANGAYESLRSPLESWEDDFNRLFAGLPARRPLGFRIWDDVMPFQGTINPTTTQVLLVESPAEMYWKARTYNTYTSKGWISEDTTFGPLGSTPEFTIASEESERFEVTYSVLPLYTSKRMFSGDRVVGASRDVEVETHSPPAYTLDLSREDLLVSFPPALATVNRSLYEAVLESGGIIDGQELSPLLPPDLMLDAVRRDQGRVVGVELVEALPVPSDVLSVRHPEGTFKSNELYEVTSAVSVAKPEQLRGSGQDYPIYVLDRYTQLPPTVPERVHSLAKDLTTGHTNTYDRVKAIEGYLKTLPYTLKIDPPPYDADGVDHFLFDQGQGYSEYFASSMAVLLRSVGIPARVAAGYTRGDEVEPGAYAVTDSHSHAWVEVYMPGFNWVPFEPTPGTELPVAYRAGIEPEDTSGETTLHNDALFLQCLDDFVPGCEEFYSGAGDANASDPFAGDALPVNTLWWWLVGALAAAAATGLGVYWFWKRYLAVSVQPAVVFGRVAALGHLAAIAPQPHQTPSQFSARLTAALPEIGRQLATVTDIYAREQYGRKKLSQEEEQQLTDAWRGLRYPLLRRMIIRRTL